MFRFDYWTIIAVDLVTIIKLEVKIKGFLICHLPILLKYGVGTYRLTNQPSRQVKLSTIKI